MLRTLSGMLHIFAVIIVVFIIVITGKLPPLGSKNIDYPIANPHEKTVPHPEILL